MAKQLSNEELDTLNRCRELAVKLHSQFEPVAMRFSKPVVGKRQQSLALFQFTSNGCYDPNARTLSLAGWKAYFDAQS